MGTRSMGIADMVGQTPIKITGAEGDDKLTFEMESGLKFRFYHCQDCCENVCIDDIIGDIQDLVGSPLLKAEEVSSDGFGALGGYEESFTWTFYKFASKKGYVDVRWYGTSNGYYSENVSLTVED